jgi:hypothetical protein
MRRVHFQRDNLSRISRHPGEASASPAYTTATYPLRSSCEPYKALLGLVSDQDIANLAGVPLPTTKASREAFDFKPAAPLPETPERASNRIIKARGLGTSRCSAVTIPPATGYLFSDSLFLPVIVFLFLGHEII